MKAKTNDPLDQQPIPVNEDQIEEIQEPVQEPAKETAENEAIEAAGLEIEHWKQKYLRALADYANLEKRTHEHVQTLQSKGKKQVLNKFLEVLDTIDKAEVFIKDPGLKMVKDNFIKAFREEGVTEMNLVGKEYDPYLADGIDVVEDEKNRNKIVEVLNKGYMLGDEVLRVAKVKVAK